MTLTIVDEARPVTGGVDTHAGTHVAAALDGIGGLLGVQEFAATPAGYARLLGWLRGLDTGGSLWTYRALSITVRHCRSPMPTPDA
jgi:transposase